MVARDRQIKADSVRPRWVKPEMNSGELQRLREQRFNYEHLADASDSQISDDEMSLLLGQAEDADTQQVGGQELRSEDLASVTGARDPDAENVDPQKSPIVTSNLPEQARAGEGEKPAANEMAAASGFDGTEGGVATAVKARQTESEKMMQRLNRAAMARVSTQRTSPLRSSM